MHFLCFKQTNFKITLKLKLKHPCCHSSCLSPRPKLFYVRSLTKGETFRKTLRNSLPSNRPNNQLSHMAPPASDLGRCRFGHTFGRALRAFPVANVGWVGGQSTLKDCTTFLFCQNMATNWSTMDSVI